MQYPFFTEKDGGIYINGGNFEGLRGVNGANTFAGTPGGVKGSTGTAALRPKRHRWSAIRFLESPGKVMCEVSINAGRPGLLNLAAAGLG